MTVMTMLKSIGYMLKCNKYLYFAKKFITVAIVVMFAACVVGTLSSQKDTVMKLKEWMG